MCANGLESATSPFVTRLLGSAVTLQRQTHHQLRSAQVRPTTGRFVQRYGQIIGLGHEMPGASGGHTAQCITVETKCYTACSRSIGPWAFSKA